VLHAHRPSTIAQRLAKRDVKISHSARVDSRLGHDLPTGNITSFLGHERRKQLSIDRHRENTAISCIVWPFNDGELIQHKGVAIECYGIANLHTQVTLSTKLSHKCCANQGQRKAKMRHEHTQIRRRQTCKHSRPRADTAHPHLQISHQTEHQPCRQQN